MRKVNTNEIPERPRLSPKGRFARAGRPISEALGRDPNSLDLSERHPFDVEIQRVPPGKSSSTFHSHSAQWEFFHVISGSGSVRHDGGTDAIVAGDAFLFKPGEAHQMTNTGTADLVVYVVADNPIGESTHYPDSRKWSVRSPQPRVIRPADAESLDYWDGEE